MTPHHDLTGRLVMHCACNLMGPVLETDAVSSNLLKLPGVSVEIAGVLMALGIYSGEMVKRASDEMLLSVPGIGPATLQKIRTYLASETQEET